MDHTQVVASESSKPPILVQPRPVYAAPVDVAFTHSHNKPSSSSPSLDDVPRQARQGWSSGTVSPPPSCSVHQHEHTQVQHVGLPYNLTQRGGSPGFRAPSRSSMRSPGLGARSQHSSPGPAELELFTQQCRVFFYGAQASEEDSWGGRKAVKQAEAAIEQALSHAPHRAHYISIQNKVRQHYHADMMQRRRDALEGMLSACPPNSGLSSTSREHLDSITARHERRVRFSDFVSTHCTRNTIGTHPFFAALAVLFAIQSRSTRSGGGGAHSIEWLLDDAVLMEAPPSFQGDAVSMLAGILGFTNVQLSRTQSSLDQDVNDPFATPTSRDPALEQYLPHTRVWTLPGHLTDPELAWLARRVPHFAHSAASKSPPLFKPAAEQTGPGGPVGALEASSSRGHVSLQSLSSVANGATSDGNAVRLPTGTARRGLQPRDAKYQGSILERIAEWIRRLLYGSYGGTH